MYHPPARVRDVMKLIKETSAHFYFSVTEDDLAKNGLYTKSSDVSAMKVFAQSDLGGRTMTTAQILAALDRLDRRPATLVDLAAYAKPPETVEELMMLWNRRDEVVALGTLLSDDGHGMPGYPFVHHSPDASECQHFMSLIQSDEGWPAHLLMLTVPK